MGNQAATVETQENCGFQEVVAQVAQVAQQIDKVGNAPVWDAEDWRAYFDERAGIVEFDGELTRPEAEARAFACCLAEWLNRNPVASSPDHCLGCGDEDQTNDPLLPFGTEINGHAWLHSRCWTAWHESRKADAIAALMAMEIEKPAKFPNDFGKNGDA